MQFKSIAEAINTGIKDSRHTQAKAKAIYFIREGQKPEKASKNCSVGLLSTARDWGMTVDLERQLKIPTHITQSKLRPDIILVSKATQQLILMELTVSGEERMEVAQERKREKFQELVENCRKNGWRTRCMTVEVGSRGFASHSLSKAYGTLGITGANRRRAIGNNVVGSRKSVQMAVVEEGRAVGAVECHLDTGRGLISLGRVARTRVSVVRPETPSDSWKQHWWCVQGCASEDVFCILQFKIMFFYFNIHLYDFNKI